MFCLYGLLVIISGQLLVVISWISAVSIVVVVVVVEAIVHSHYCKEMLDLGSLLKKKKEKNVRKNVSILVYYCKYILFSRKTKHNKRLCRIDFSQKMHTKNKLKCSVFFSNSFHFLCGLLLDFLLLYYHHYCYSVHRKLMGYESSTSWLMVNLTWRGRDFPPIMLRAQCTAQHCRLIQVRNNTTMTF